VPANAFDIPGLGFLVINARRDDMQRWHLHRQRRHPDHHSRSLLAQFGLTPKSKRGLAARDPGEPADPLDEL
jgi:type IV secretory pathway VirD2 relaxase